jgi:hypothetical protein
VLCRYVKQGRTILQPHHLLDELNDVADADEAETIKDSAFGTMLYNSQVLHSNATRDDLWRMDWEEVSPDCIW